MLTIIPPLSAFLSIVGSGVIIYFILSDRERKLGKVYHRLLFCMSIMAIILAIAVVPSSTMVPSEVGYVWGNRGNLATCEMQGYLLHLGGLSVPIYTGCLSIYFLLMLRFGIKERAIARYYEPFFHLSGLLYPLVMATYALLNDYFNPLSIIQGICWMNANPPNCNVPGSPQECIRGKDVTSFDFYFTACLILFVSIVLLVNLTVIYWRVRSQERTVERRYSSFVHASRGSSTQRMATQAFLYIGAFFLNFIFNILLTFVPESIMGREVKFVLVFGSKVFLPLQGFFHCCIYLRPRMQALKRKSPPNTSKLALFRQALASPKRASIVSMHTSAPNQRRLSSVHSSWVSRSNDGVGAPIEKSNVYDDDNDDHDDTVNETKVQEIDIDDKEEDAASSSPLDASTCTHTSQMSNRTPSLSFGLFNSSTKRGLGLARGGFPREVEQARNEDNTEGHHHHDDEKESVSQSKSEARDETMSADMTLAQKEEQTQRRLSEPTSSLSDVSNAYQNDMKEYSDYTAAYDDEDK